MTLKILIHTFRMIFGNFGQALKISIGPFLIILSIVVVVMIDSTGLLSNRPLRDETGFLVTTPLMSLMPFILPPLLLFVVSWLAVSWHRTILLEERNGFLPTLKDQPVWQYAGKAILIVLPFGCVIIMIRWIFGFTSHLEPQFYLLAGGMYRVYAVIYYGCLVLLIASLLRLGVWLVATSIGQSVGIRESWQQTSKASGAIIIIATIIILYYALQPYLALRFSIFIRSYLSDQQMLVAALVRPIILNWFIVIFGTSIMTTIYGHVFEGRPLTD